MILTRRELFANAEEYKELIVKMKSIDEKHFKKIDEDFRILLF